MQFRFLFCDVYTNPGHSKCTTKVKSQGNCTGFEWSTEVCYYTNEKCINGRCTKININDYSFIPKIKNYLFNDELNILKKRRNNLKIEQETNLNKYM